MLQSNVLALSTNKCALMQVMISNMPNYRVGEKLGKGGFGQVFQGTRVQQRKVTPVNKPNQVRSLQPDVDGSAMGHSAACIVC